MLPVTLYVYFKYGRATHPSELGKGGGHCHSDTSPSTKAEDGDSGSTTTPTNAEESNQNSGHCHSQQNGEEHVSHQASESEIENGNSEHHCHDDSSRPMWATVLVGVSHCGAGCVLGDIVGEWLVYGSGAMINGAELWPALLVDYAFALLFGIVFQYFSIAPMSGEYGPKTVWRAAKADFLSLTSFEVGAFG